MGRYEVEVHIKGEKKEQEQYLATLTIRYTLSIKNNYLTHVSLSHLSHCRDEPIRTQDQPHLACLQSISTYMVVFRK